MSEPLRYTIGEVEKEQYSNLANGYFNVIDKAFPPEEHKTADVHYKLIDHFLTSKKNRIGIEASRGIGKSRHIGNYLPIIIPLLGLGIGSRKKHNFIIVISATFDNAVDMIQEVKDLYEIMKPEFKELITPEIWKSDEISFRLADGETLSIVAMGAEGKIRGIRRKGKRPDALIFDDSEYEELTLNADRMKKWKKWVFRSAIPALSPDGVVLWVGTPLPNSLLGELKESDSWDFISLPIIDDFGTPAWIDRFPFSWIQETKSEMKKLGEINAWFQEFELKIINEEEQIFKPSMFRYTSMDDMPDDIDIYIMCDLAISSSSSADRTSFCVVGVDSLNNIYLIEIFAERCPVSKQVDVLIDMAQRYYEVNKGLITIGMEKGALKYSFMDYWNRKINEMGYNHKIPKIGELDPYGGKNAKNRRIQQLEPLFNKGQVKFIKGIKYLKDLEEEMLSFPAGKHDDIVDSLSYLLQIVRWREDLPSEPVRHMADLNSFTGVIW